MNQEYSHQLIEILKAIQKELEAIKLEIANLKRSKSIDTGPM